MDLTQGTGKEKNARAKKMMLWFGIVSLLMGFAGWTSAYIVSSSREDWIKDLALPSSFLGSTLVIIISSITYIMAKKAIRQDRTRQCTNWLLLTLVLGITFIILQFNGFSQMVANGYYFTGPTSNIKMSYVFLIAAVHIVHVVAGIISLLVVIANQLRNKYSPKEMLGLELGATFWHFLDILWVYLILFMYFVN
ncbi:MULTISPECIES: cytochrome c oxidase subunit 3 [unclassified Arenibacter]|jgi:cytochrome c oxidase subunit 3|uniref:cytochrome c oxidase subunit 3 n=1 Tax=unclassified Arenibacter TaxID=2615047 RepID=UPI000E355B74|nr:MULTISPECIES: cytochrome c oxidase subunit 3 [unclassified Arenibacter]MCM4162701.1 cytochrome oxidase subunit III [Arenibacter sp. A80]RFT58266.1 heme-copper oxidase subunit III [Arenibacter sp. P308M17]